MLLNQTELMKEDAEDGQWAHETYQKEVEREFFRRYGGPIRELFLHHFAGYIPSYKEAGKESADGQKYLSSNEIEYIKEALARYREAFYAS